MCKPTSALLAVASLLLFAASANARYYVSEHPVVVFRFESHSAVIPSTDPYPAMLNAAQDYWNSVAPCGTVHLQFVSSTPIPGVDAYVPQNGAGDCTIFMLRSYWGSWENIVAHYPQYCRLIVHEFAHLLDNWDVGTPNTIMSFVVEPTVVLPQCDSGSFRESGAWWIWHRGHLITRL